MSHCRILFFATLLIGALQSELGGQQPAKPPQRPKLPSDVSNARYGPHERHVLDLWKAKSDRPTPLVVFIHGGGFQVGDKSNLSPILLRDCLQAGISVASINYRFSRQAIAPGPMVDGARAVQFLRSKAKEWNLDPQRVAATGGSAGAGISLWIGFHDDLAKPKSDDPVERQSRRLTCVGVTGAQTSYDPRVIKEWVGGRAYEHPALRALFGLKPGEPMDAPRAHKLFEEASAITHLTADDPPVFLFYNEPKGPLPADAKVGQGIHHPNFGVKLKEKMDALKIECVLRHADDYKGKNIGEEMNREMVAFFVKHFNVKKAD